MSVSASWPTQKAGCYFDGFALPTAAVTSGRTCAAESMADADTPSAAPATLSVTPATLPDSVSVTPVRP
jgi:hypothetical protein